MYIRGTRFFLTEVLIKISFLFSELSDFFHSLPVAVLKPSDLIEINNRHYSNLRVIENWEQNTGIGLSPSEKLFCEKYGSPGLKILVIGCGPGRESIVLARQGFQVTAIDSSLPMLEAARRNTEAARVKVDLRALSLYDIGRIEQSFDMIFLGVNYGMIPTCLLRRDVLLSVKKILKPSGALLLSFTGYEPSKYYWFRYFFYKIISFLVCGNIKVEKGDFIFGTGEFHHCFDSIDTVIKEAVSAGFFVDVIQNEENTLFLKARP
jgi:2-polyprenyl-3-methyl-5-hydroxy-6-metoxy-1,4-benzoquinol methylase